VKPSLINRTPIEEKVVVLGKSPRHGRRLTALGCLLAALLFVPTAASAQEDPAAAEHAAAAIEAAEDALPPKHVDVSEDDDEEGEAVGKDAASKAAKEPSSPQEPEAVEAPVEASGEPKPAALAEQPAKEKTVKKEVAPEEPPSDTDAKDEAREDSVKDASPRKSSVLDQEVPESTPLPSPDALFEEAAREKEEAARASEEEVAETVVEEEEASPEEVAADAARHKSAPEHSAPEPAKAPEGLSPQPASMITLEVVQRLFDDVKGLDLRKHHDFTPYPYASTPEWNEAMALMREDECRKALGKIEPLQEKYEKEKLEANAQDAFDYSIARMQLCAGKKGDAGKILRRLAKGEGPTSRLAKRSLGMRVEEPVAAEDEDAKTLSEKLSWASKQARDEKKLDETLETLAQWRHATTRGWAWYRVRLTEAEILERSGRIDDARDVWYSIYLRTRDWRSGSKIEEMIEAFEKRQEVQVIGIAERVDRMRELISRGRYKDARRVSVDNAKIAKLSSKETRAWTWYRQGLEKERNKDREDAVALFEKAEASMEHDAVRPRLYFGWARALRRLDRDNEAIDLYDRLCDEYPNESLCPDAMYEAGRLLQYQNRHAEAQKHFHALVTLHPFHRDVPDALWRASFSAYLEGKWEQARAPLQHILAHYANERDASELTMGLKAQYWLGVIALKSGDRELARRELQETIDAGPLTWYGRLAASRLVSMGMRPLISLPATRLTIDDLTSMNRVAVPYHPRLEEAVELIRAGLYDDAIGEVGRQMRKYPRPDGIERLMANLQLVVGRPDLAHWEMKSHISEAGPTLRNIRDWGTAFPLQYMSTAHQWGIKYGVDPFLVQAIIRQESGFRPEVKSYAGAVGLMQLMPGTARYTARVFLEDDGVSYRRRDLIKPEQNIRLGTMYIRVHTAHAVDNVALALAGYNAGPAPLQRWIRQYGDRELDAFVESITYREARGYVRKVMTSYITYSGLYGDGRLPTLQMTVPKKLRKWGDIPEVEKMQPGDAVSQKEQKPVSSKRG
jgi:soluble lytic murein transglycosylase-like protein/TolA-binding protein